MQDYQQYVDKFYGYVVQYGTSFVAALLILVIGKWVARLLSRLVEKLMVQSKIDKTLVSFSKNILYYTMMVFVVIAALTKLGVQTTSFVAVLGACGLAIGFALQGSLSNFAAGVLLILFMPFKVGEVIEAAGVTGTVDEVQIFSTILVTTDKKRVIIPNSKITADKITVFPRT